MVQIKGKVRAKLEVPVDIDPADLEKQALAAVADRLGGKEPRKVIVKAPEDRPPSFPRSDLLRASSPL